MSIDRNKLEKAISAQHKSAPFSGVISIQEMGKMDFSLAYGLANIAEAIPNTISTRFGTASGTKTFTSVAICKLIENGKIDYSTTLSKILDIDFPNYDRNITIHHLLSHSSGMPDYYDEEIMHDYSAVWKENCMYKFREPKDFLPLFQNQAMKDKPGTKWHYNNAGYILLGLIIEKVAQMPYVEFIQKNIFDPCGMNDSGFFFLDNLPARTALGYIEEEKAIRTNIYSIPIVGGPDGGAFCTLKDISSFWNSVQNPKYLMTDTFKKIIHPHFETEDGYYGYGLWINNNKDKSIDHYMLGEDPGVAFFSSLNLQKNFQITVFGNKIDNTWPMIKVINDQIKAA